MPPYLLGYLALDNSLRHRRLYLISAALVKNLTLKGSDFVHYSNSRSFGRELPDSQFESNIPAYQNVPVAADFVKSKAE